MHQPPFLSWILQHDTTVRPCSTTPCLKCYLRQLALEYWGPNANIPVAQNTSIQGIVTLSWLSSFYQQGQQEDANLFYDWITNTLREDLE